MRRRPEAVGVVPDSVPETSNSRKRANEAAGPFLLLRHLKGPCFLENEISKKKRIATGTKGEVWKVECDILGVCASRTLNISDGRFGSGSALNDEIILHRQLLNHSLKRELQVTNDAQRELEYTQEVAHHPNIVGFFGYLQRVVKGDKLYIGLITEYMEGGSVAQMMVGNPSYLTEGRVVSYALDIGRALAACHTKYNIMHRDVKPSNVLLTGDRKTAKLSDFGYAKKAEVTNNTNKKGSWFYMAPELINENDPLHLIPYAFKPDVWSFSMFVYAMTFKRDPFTEADLKHTQTHRDKLFRGERPSTTEWPMEEDGFKAGILDVITKGWATNPDLRRDMIDTVTQLKRMSARIQQTRENL